MSIVKIETSDWHKILDALNMYPESTATDVVKKISILQRILKKTRRELFNLEQKLDHSSD